MVFEILYIKYFLIILVFESTDQHKESIVGTQPQKISMKFAQILGMRLLRVYRHTKTIKTICPKYFTFFEPFLKLQIGFF